MQPMTKKVRMAISKSTKPHPLEKVVLEAFEKNTRPDVSLVKHHCLSSPILQSRNFAQSQRAYRIVATDVLEYMECQGKNQTRQLWRVFSLVPEMKKRPDL
jgi:hypothetical protein